MVAKIRTGRCLKGAIYYNEHKVEMGKAELLEAFGYIKDPSDLSFREKLGRLADLTERNQRARTNTVHISLNFSNEDTLDTEKVKAIAAEYLSGIGFAGQPYLLYRHHDAGHPHLHLVTTNIRHNGERINLHNVGKNESEVSRKKIEDRHGLIKAEGRTAVKPAMIIPNKAIYGRSETKRTISNILSHVLNQYLYTSVPELNAVLSQYNVEADMGSKESLIRKNGGLIFWMTDKGVKQGIPIKASSIYGKPTLPALDQKFKLNITLRQGAREPVKQKIDAAFSQTSGIDTFRQALQNSGIDLILRINETGLVYGITFVDHQLKVVFNGSDLGKSYSANQLVARFGIKDHTEPAKKTVAFLPTKLDDNTGRSAQPPFETLDILLKQEHEDLGALKKFKKRKRKKGLRQ